VIPSSVDFFWRVAPLAPCAIVSGSSRGDVAAAARMCGIYDALAFVMGLEDYPRGKPHPDGYLLAAERLGVDPAACVVIEDSTAVVKAGHAAGMRVLGVNRSCSVPQDYSLCSWCVADLAQFDVASAFGGVPQN
jgi:beta-phosphoglucomutase-like phosphatase (HAD superfamily)